MPIRKPTKKEVDALVAYTGEGHMQCARELKHYFAHEHCVNATTLEELKEVLLYQLGSPTHYIKSALEAANKE